MPRCDRFTDPALKSVRQEWPEEFEAARKRPLATRFRNAFIKTYKPVLLPARAANPYAEATCNYLEKM